MARWGDFLQRLRGDDRDRERQRWLAILGLNRALAAADGPRAVLTVLVDEAVRLFAAERGFLLRSAAGGAGFEVELARSLDREPVASPDRKVSTTVVERALAGEAVFSEDAQAGPLAAARSVADLRLRSVLCAPLRVGDRVLGALYLDHRFQAGAFVEADLPWLLAFADQGAIVLHLHALLADNRRQATALAEHNRSLQAAVEAQAQVLAEPEVPPRAALRHRFDELVGASPSLLRALHVLDRVAPTDLAVLLTGESGTGKEVAARCLHGAGPRASGPFVGVNVAAISAELLASELFGHARGAFTGADRERPGLMRQAHGGTLFLDEIGEMDVELQARLLRALEERRVRPVGSDREQDVDVRVIAATNRDPQQAIAEGRLREDLYFRLAVVTVHMPPLRDRGDDVELLAAELWRRQCTQDGAPLPPLDEALCAALRSRRWPGNVRQLQNELRRLAALAGDGPPHAGMLSPELERAGEAAEAEGLPFDLAAIERWAIRRALRASAGNKAEAARLLGIARRTLYGKLDG